VTPLLRVLLATAAALVGTALSVEGQPVPGADADPLAGLSPEMIAAVTKLISAWNYEATLEGSFGYKHNVLLSHTELENSTFLRGHAYAEVTHALPERPTSYSLFALGERTAYFSSPAMGHEALAFAGGEWRYQSERLKLNLEGRGAYYDAVEDVSDTEVQRVSERLVSRSATVTPTIRWLPRAWLWFEAEGAGTRIIFRDETNNADVAGGTARIGWKPGARFEFSVAGTDERRIYDHRQAVTVDGVQPLDDDGNPLIVPLRIREREAEVRADVTWDRAGHWKTKTRVSWLNYDDNFSGFFDFRQRKLRQQIDWESGNWKVSLDGYARRNDFKVQNLAQLFPGFNPPKRNREEFSAELQVERNLGKQWTAFLGYNWGRSHSNDITSSYRTNESLLGARWTWEK
jgi:hypothetical protein